MVPVVSLSVPVAACSNGSNAAAAAHVAIDIPDGSIITTDVVAPPPVTSETMKKDAAAAVVVVDGNGDTASASPAPPPLATCCRIVLQFGRCTAYGAFVRAVFVVYMVLLLPLLCLEVFPRAPLPVSLLNAFLGVLLMYGMFAVLRDEIKKQQEEDQAAAAAAAATAAKLG